MPPASSLNGSPAQTRFMVANCSSNFRPRVVMSVWPATKSSGRPPMPSPRLSLPPEMASTLAACLASIAPLRSGASNMDVISLTLLGHRGGGSKNHHRFVVGIDQPVQYRHRTERPVIRLSRPFHNHAAPHPWNRCGQSYSHIHVAPPIPWPTVWYVIGRLWSEYSRTRRPQSADRRVLSVSC